MHRGPLVSVVRGKILYGLSSAPPFEQRREGGGRHAMHKGVDRERKRERQSPQGLHSEYCFAEPAISLEKPIISLKFRVCLRAAEVAVSSSNYSH